MKFQFRHPWCRGAVPLAVTFLVGCLGSDEPVPPDYHYTRNEVPLYADLQRDAPVLAILDFDSTVIIQERHRSFARVLTGDRLDGWLDTRMLLDSELRQQLRALTNQSAALTSQGRSRARDTLNVHTEPYRWAPTFYQLETDEEFEILDRMVVDRLPSYDKDEPKPAPTGEDYWYLVRVPAVGETGWLIANMAYADLPLHIAMLAGGRSIVAYFKIGEVEDESLGETKPTWLWFQSTGRGKTHDFDLLRVFRWDSRRDRYLVIRQVSDLVGYLPVEIERNFDTRQGRGTAFRFVLEREGELRERTYAYVGRQVYFIEESALLGAPRRVPPGGYGKRFD